MPLYSIQASDPAGAKSNMTNTIVLSIIGATAVIFLVVLVLTIRKRKIRARLWEPEGWASSLVKSPTSTKGQTVYRDYYGGYGGAPDIKRQSSFRG